MELSLFPMGRGSKVAPRWFLGEGAPPAVLSEGAFESSVSPKEAQPWRSLPLPWESPELQGPGGPGSSAAEAGSERPSEGRRGLVSGLQPPLCARLAGRRGPGSACWPGVWVGGRWGGEGAAGRSKANTAL